METSENIHGRTSQVTLAEIHEEDFEILSTPLHIYKK